MNQVSLTSPVAGITVLEVLGHGGFSVVYRGRQESVGREVALKVDNRMVRDERDRRRFLREAHAAGQLSDHPNVISVFDAGITEDGRPYLVMELCTAGSLADRLRKDGALPAPDVREVGVRIADALEAAHTAGVLHRDLKPANILVNRFGSPGLADFGLAANHDPTKQLSATLEALTPAYAAPEMFRMERPTIAVDVYGLGATLYSLLSGRPPRWPANGYPSIATIIGLQSEPVEDLPGVPGALTAVLRKAMANDPGDRYPTAAALRDALQGVALDAPTGMFTAIPAAGHGPASISGAAAAVGPPAWGAPSASPGPAPSPTASPSHAATTAMPAATGTSTTSGTAIRGSAAIPVSPPPASAGAAPASSAAASTSVMPTSPPPRGPAPTAIAPAARVPNSGPGMAPPGAARPGGNTVAAPPRRKRRKWPYALMLVVFALFLGITATNFGLTGWILNEVNSGGNSGGGTTQVEDTGGGPAVNEPDVPVTDGSTAPQPEQTYPTTPDPKPTPTQPYRGAEPTTITSAGLGPFRVDEPVKPLLEYKIAKRPQSESCDSSTQLVATGGEYSDVTASQDGRLISHVIIQNDAYRTRSGLRIGSSEDDVRAIPDVSERDAEGTKAFVVRDGGNALLFIANEGAVTMIVVGRSSAINDIASRVPSGVC